MTDRIATFAYRLRRKLGRELRRRSAPLYTSWDRRRVKTESRANCSKSVLLRFAKLAPWADFRRRSTEDWAGPDELAAVVGQADRACAHVFDLLGSGEVHLGSEIDWHLDFKTGHRWSPDVHHLGIRWDQVPEGTDIKVPWELSRCLHFSTLGFADWITGDEKYYREFKEQVRSWIRANRYEHGVNWVCAMDVAIRAVNWLNAVMMFGERIEGDDDSDFCDELVGSLSLHGRHIMRNLEWQGPKSAELGNHFVADITGLLAVGSLFPDAPRGKNYLLFARQWLEVEMNRQVFEDGSLYETSTSYHRLTLEMFLWSATLAERQGRPLSQGYRSRLKCMSGFVRAYTSPSGFAAQFGDNDSGRLLSCGIDQGLDHRYLADGDCGFGGRFNRLLLHGGVGERGPEEARREHFPDGGFWFLRSGAAWVGVRAGVVSHHGAHAHCDQLSFVLAVGGEDFIIDPGTGVYTADVSKRNHYRSGAAHNACRINGWDANSFPDGKMGLFLLGDDTATEIVPQENERGASSFVGKHFGYGRHRQGMTCQRSLVLDDEFLEIRDQFELLEAADELSWSFCFAPGVVLTRDGDAIVVSGESVELRFVPEFECEMRIVKAFCSPAYGVEEPCAHLLVETSESKPGNGDYGIRVSWSASNHSIK